MKVLNVIAVATLLLATASMQARADWWGQNPTESYNRSGNSYARGETLGAGTVMEGIVLSVRPVVMESTATASTTGTVTGGALGALAGSNIGKGKGKIAGAIVGGVLGAGIGQATGEAISEKTAGEIVLELEDRRKIFVVQADGLQFAPMQPVYVLTSGNSMWGGGSYRVVPRPTP